MKYLSIITLLIIGAYQSVQAYEVGTWNYLYLMWKATDNWDTHLYLDDDRYEGRPSQHVLSLRMRRKLGNRFKVGLNYVQFHKTAHPVHQRFELAGFYQEKLGNFSLSHRSRVEYWVYEASQLSKWRYRHLWALSYKINDQFGVGAAEEWMTRTQYSDNYLVNNEVFEKYQNWLDPVFVTYKHDKVNKFKLYYRIYHEGETLGDLVRGGMANRHYIGFAYFVNFLGKIQTDCNANRL